MDKSTCMDYYFNKREGGGVGVRVHIWIITLINGRREWAKST